jgi:hypothetical protein
MIELAFQILKGICYVNQKGLTMKSMLRMEQIHLDENVSIDR